MLSKFKRTDFIFAWYLKQNSGTIYDPTSADLFKFKVSLLQEKATEIETIDFVGCYATQLRDDIYAVTTISAEISMHIQLFILVKTSFFLKWIQKSGLITEMVI